MLWGLNSRLDNLQAAILNLNLKHYDRQIARRREIAAPISPAPRSLSELRLPPGPDDDPGHFDIFQNYEIEPERRDALKAFLARAGRRHAHPMGRQAGASVLETGLSRNDCPYAMNSSPAC